METSFARNPSATPVASFAILFHDTASALRRYFSASLNFSCLSWIAPMLCSAEAVLTWAGPSLFSKIASARLCSLPASANRFCAMSISALLWSAIPVDGSSAP